MRISDIVVVGVERDFIELYEQNKGFNSNLSSFTRGKLMMNMDYVTLNKDKVLLSARTAKPRKCNPLIQVRMRFKQEYVDRIDVIRGDVPIGKFLTHAMRFCMASFLCDARNRESTARSTARHVKVVAEAEDFARRMNEEWYSMDAKIR